MAQDPVSARYAEALFGLARDQRKVEETQAQLEELAVLLRAHAPLRQFLVNPDVEIPDKLAVLAKLRAGGWSELVQGLVRLALTLGRASSLAEMADAFRDLADAERGLVRATVRTARPLSASLRSRIARVLEQREGKTVELTEQTDPTLLGGLQILMGQRMLDGSLRTQLAQLKQRLKRVRVL